MTYQIHVKRQAPKEYVATLLSWPGLKAHAPTREEALSQIRKAVIDWLADGEIVEMEIAAQEPIIASGYAETFGFFRDDPTFAEFVTEIERYRQEKDRVAEVESEGA